MIPVVVAHGLAGRADLPLPAEWFGAGAAIVLAVSFAALAAGWSSPRLQSLRRRPLERLPRALEIALGTLGVLAFAAVVSAGLAGTQIPTDNLAPTTVYVLFWVGVPFVSILFGDVFRPLNPWRAIGRAGGALIRRLGGPELSEPLPYPERLGRWPAVAGLFVFAAVELCWRNGNDPSALAILALVYATVQLAGMGLFGVEAWSRNGDAFGVYFGFFGSLSPLSRPPLAGAPAIDARPRATAAVLVVGIGSTMFDGAKEGPLFGDLAPRLQDAFTALGLSKGAALELSFLCGLVIAVAVIGAIYAIGVWGMRQAGGAHDAPLASAFAHSLIPIAAAYVVAHYFSLLVFQGQAMAALVSDPLGRGSDLFGSAGATIDFGVVSTTAIWYVQVGALVVGHVLALVLAHDRALAVFRGPGAATRSQFAMLGVMIGFTVIGMWQLSVANA